MNSEVAFDLENAAWPTLLVNANGAVLLANAAAKNIFGSVLKDERPSLASLWSQENNGTSMDFLALWQESQPVVTVLKFRLASGPAISFPTAICRAGDPEKKQVGLQLLLCVGALSAESGAQPDTALK